MLSFEEAQEALTEIADRIPPAIYRELNGGIILLPEAKPHPKGTGNDLYILGEYHVEPMGFGRYITIYYGSFAVAHGHLPDESFKKRLEEVLNHELVHHLEHLAGDKSLEIKDHQFITEYQAKKQKNDSSGGCS